MSIPEDRPRALLTRPVDPTLGPYRDCEVCRLWFPEDELEYLYCRDRCPECRVNQGNRSPGPSLFRQARS